METQPRRSLPAVLAFLFICILLVSSTDAQVIGADICACSPSTFTFRFNFSLTCPPVNVTIGDGIKETTCSIITLDPSEDVTDEVPILVTDIQIIEVDVGGQVLPGSPTNIMGAYEDGETFTYTSLAAEGAETVEQLVGGLQMSVTGENAEGQALSLTWAITYTNECGIEPILEVGESAGWVAFEDLTPPRQELCPGTTTEAPSLSPVSAPISVAPVVTDPPTVAPGTGPPTKAPIPVTSAPVTEPPTEAPVTGPPTIVPVTHPPLPRPVTDPPTTVPVSEPQTSQPDTPPPVGQPPVSPPTDAPELQPTTPPPPTLPTPMSMSYSMSFDVRIMEEGMNEAELFEFGRAI